MKDISTEALQAELSIRDEAKKTDAPKQAEKPDIDPLRVICQQYIDAVVTDGYVSPATKELQFHIFQTAMQTVFGDDVWSWNNQALTR